MKNDYEIRGENVAIFINSRKYGVIETIISLDKLELVSNISGTWFVSYNTHSKSFYVSVAQGGGGSKVVLHRLIMDFPEGRFVDHINHDTLDNRNENLRILSNMENQQNRKGGTSRNKSGVRNVHWHKLSKKWEVQIKVAKKKITIGHYNDLEAASAAASEARKIYMPYSDTAI